MKTIFNKNLIILFSFIAMIAGAILYTKTDSELYDISYVIMPLMLLKYAYIQDNWRRILKYRKCNFKHMKVIAFSLAAATIISLAAMYYPYVCERVEAPYMNNFTQILRGFCFVVLYILFCLTIHLDIKVKEKVRSSIKCSRFEENSSCYKTSCINCAYAEEMKILKNDRIRIELIKDDKFYAKKLKNIFNKLIKFEDRAGDRDAFQKVLENKYDQERFDSLFLKY